MRVTIRDVARHASVSSGTVSRVLNGADGVGADMRHRVLSAVRELGYAHTPPRQREAGRAGRVGFVLCLREVEESSARLGMFWADILHGAEEYARGQGGHVVFRGLRHHEHPEQAVAQIADLELGAALVVGPAGSGLVEALTARGIPLVLVDNTLPGADVTSVVSDNLGGSLLAVDHLLDLGHRDVAFVGGPTVDGRPGTNSIASIRQRALGYRTALRERGVEVRDALVEGCDLTPEGGAAAARRLLDSGARFTAVFCANDPTARGVLRTLREAGLDVPGRVSVVGFDDDMAADTVPPLTTVRVPREAMGAVAVKTLLDEVGGGAAPRAAVPLTLTVPVELVVRASTAPPRSPAR